MKAEAIRKHRDAVKNLGKLMVGSKNKEAIEYITCWVLHEIAAQLAELNENLGQVIGHQKAYSGGYVGGVRIIKDF